MSYTKEERERDEREEELAAQTNTADAMERLATSAAEGVEVLRSAAFYLEQIARDNASDYSVAYAIRVLNNLDAKDVIEVMGSFCRKCGAKIHTGSCSK